MWQADPLALVITVSDPVVATFRVPLDPIRHMALINAVLRDGGIYVVPTTPRLGINARLAREHSVWVDVDRSFADTWRTLAPPPRGDRR